jgi:hypothetical protein
VLGLERDLSRSCSIQLLTLAVCHALSSQAAFQEFLKRIPSATNLAANQQFEPNQLQQAHQLLSASGNGGGAAAANLSAGLTSEAGQGTGGMPRVPSLDVLRQLVIQNQLGQGLSQPGVVKSEAAGGETDDLHSLQA